MDNSIGEKNKCFVSAVVYYHNSSVEKLNLFFDKIVKTLNDNFENIEVIIVCDDEYSLKNEEINKMIEKDDKKLMVSKIQMAYYQGYEAAMCAGDDITIGDFVFEFDSVEFDYEPELILEVYNKAKSGYDVVSAGQKKMKLTSWIFYKMMNHRSFYTLRHESFRIVSRRALNRIKMYNTNIHYRKLQYATCGLPVTYIEYKSINGPDKRKCAKEASYRLNTGINYMMMFTHVTEKITQILSLIFLAASIGTGIWAVYSYFNDADIVAGWVSLMGVISFGFFGVFLLLSFVIKYMILMMDSYNRNKNYVIESVDKI